MTPLPEFFPSPVHLPFNNRSLQERFRPGTPDADPKGTEGHLVLLRGSELLAAGPSDDLRLPRGPIEEISGEASPSPLYLGTWDGEPCRALAWPRERPLPEGLSAQSLLAAEPNLSISLMTLAGTAGQILHWEKNSRYCARCGGPLERIAGHWGKKCPACVYSHFPHIHPCAIVLVRREGEVLLTRKAEWPDGRYSLVAGFVDFGECLEEAVDREVLEETGVRVKDIRYVGSQCWPFPSQLMAGFTAEYAGGEVRVEEKELEDARWFPVSELPVMPPRRSIARFILDHYLEKTETEKGP
jgi:NAD+ diphosphatase